MKKSNRTVRKMRSAWTGFTTACLAAALTMSALVSCAPQESRPVVTSDDLTPPSAAQEAIAQDIGGGKNYAYLLAGGKCGRKPCCRNAAGGAMSRIVDTLRKGLIAQGEDSRQSGGIFVPWRKPQQAVDWHTGRHALEREPADSSGNRCGKQSWRWHPVVSAQEAANLAGVPV